MSQIELPQKQTIEKTIEKMHLLFSLFGSRSQKTLVGEWGSKTRREGSQSRCVIKPVPLWAPGAHFHWELEKQRNWVTALEKQRNGGIYLPAPVSHWSRAAPEGW